MIGIGTCQESLLVTMRWSLVSVLVFVDQTDLERSENTSALRSTWNPFSRGSCKAHLAVRIVATTYPLENIDDKNSVIRGISIVLGLRSFRKERKPDQVTSYWCLVEGLSFCAKCSTTSGV